MKKVLLFCASFMLVSGCLQAQTILDSVLVIGTRATKKMPVAQTTIYQQEIDDERVGREMPFLLNMLPSIVTYSDNGTSIGSTSFRIRGTDASRTNITIDGVPLNDAESQSVFWVNIPDLGAISKSLQVQRGVGTSTFGSSAFGGLLNIETREISSEANASFENSYGSFNTWNVAASAGTGLINDAFAFDANYKYVSSDGYLERSGLWQQAMNFNGVWKGKNHLLRASILYGEQHSMLTFEGVPYELLNTNRRFNMSGIYGNNQFYDNETDNYQQLQTRINYTQQIGKAWKLAATLFYTKGEGYYEQYKEAASLSKYGIPTQVIDGTSYKKSDLIRQKGLNNDFYGLNISAIYESKQFDLILGAGANRYDGDHYGKVIWTQYNTGNIDHNYDWYDNTGIKDDQTIFAKISYNVTKSFSLFADMQLRNVSFKMSGLDDDYHEKQAAGTGNPSTGILDTNYHWLFVNPKIGLTFAPSSKHNAFVSFAVGNREPNRADLKDADKNGIRTPAQSERLYDWEAGYTFRPTFGQFSVVAYYMNYHNQIVATGRVNDAYRSIMENIPDSYRAGIELSAAVRPLQQLQIEGNFTWSRNKLKNYTSYVDEYDNANYDNYVGQRAEFFKEATIAYSPDIIASAAVRWFPLTNLSVALTGKYVGAQYYDNTQNDSRKLDAYFTANLQANYDFEIAKKIRCFAQLSVNNLFDAMYSTWAFVNYRTTFADGSNDYQELRYFPQAGINAMLKVGLKF